MGIIGMPGPGTYSQKEAEYREYAEEMLLLAKQTDEPSERGTLLRMAEAWLKLAERMKELRS
jgi:hypothetical protein